MILFAFKRENLIKFIKSKDGRYMVTSYIALLLGVLTGLLIVVASTRIIYMTFWYPTIELPLFNNLGGIASLIGAIGVLAWGKSFDTKAIDSNIINKEDYEEESEGIRN
jgi:hypothetical protein